jgi:hypothetical protein
VNDVSPIPSFGGAPGAERVQGADDAVTWAPGPWSTDPAPATRHARPAAFGRGPAQDDDPPTDPHGFPPIAADPAVDWPAPARPPRHAATAPPPDPREAAALAGAFAADYLSWDEDDPARRGRALADHLAAPAGDPTLLGWDGRGRQRAEFALPGPVRPDGDDRVLVDVRVRVTPYRAVGERAPGGADSVEPDTVVPGVPAAAPAPTGRGWRGCASYWVRLSVPVLRDDGRLVVDAADETSPEPTDPGAQADAEPPVPTAVSSSPRDLRPVPDLDPGGAW